MAFLDQQNTTGRHAKSTPQVTTQNPEDQAIDAALREARNWAALRSVSVYQCPMSATARLAVTSPKVKTQAPTERTRRRLSLAALWHLMRK
jgi:hypothetical protein